MEKFRIAYVLPVFSLIVLALMLTANGHAGEHIWLYYGNNLDFTGYYNPETIQCLPNSEMKIWEKWIIKEKYIAGLIEYAERYDKEKINKYKEATYEIMQSGLNCNARLKVTYNYATYTKDGVIIDKSENDNPKWTATIPDSVSDKLLDVVCGYCNSNKILEQK